MKNNTHLLPNKTPCPQPPGFSSAPLTFNPKSMLKTGVEMKLKTQTILDKIDEIFVQFFCVFEKTLTKTPPPPLPHTMLGSFELLKYVGKFVFFLFQLNIVREGAGRGVKTVGRPERIFTPKIESDLIQRRQKLFTVELF